MTMMKKMSKIRYLCAPFIPNNRQSAIFWACFILFVIVPFVSCLALEFGSYDHAAYLQYCNAKAFEEKYAAKECWSCDIIAILMDVMIDVIERISSTALSLAKIILIYGSALWLAMFFLKSLSAAKAQDPAQVLTAVFTFMFKVALVYVLVVDYGFSTLIEWIVNPLLSIGLDIGSEFSYWAGGGA